MRRSESIGLVGRRRAVAAEWDFQMTRPAPTDADPMRRLLEIMRRLRDPVDGCPWDVAQGFADIAPYTIEEAYEVAECVETGDLDALKAELGDLLFQVVFYAQIADDEGKFGFADVAAAIGDKMVARHPHVFECADGRDADGQIRAWEARKAFERARKADADGRGQGLELSEMTIDQQEHLWLASKRQDRP